MTDALLEAAARIGRRLVRQARWQGDACTWTIMSPDRSDPDGRRALPTAAGGTVYSGTAGIALFLAELFRHTGEAELRRAALGAVRHALADETMPRNQFGFHSGRVGIAYAAVRAAQAFGRGELLDAAREFLAPLAGREDEDIGDDVVAGAAGAIAPLLRLARDLDGGPAAAMAARLGERLIARAVREPVGWSWGDPRQVTHARYLCGLAHGAAGMGAGLLELYAATGDARFRYGAEQAFVYERQFFDPARGNWPDFRHKGLSQYLHRSRVRELRERLAEGEPLAYTPRFMVAWCHGAAGIALTRLRAWELLGAEVYRAEAVAAVEASRRSLEGGAEAMGNFSLCHGALGNAEPLLDGARILRRPGLLARAREMAAAACERFEAAGRPWPCGTPGGAADPSLLLGEAGIGYALLRLHDPDTPSVLLPTAPPPVAAAAPETRAAAERLRRDEISLWFGHTAGLLARSAAGDTELPPPDAGEPRAAPAAAREAIARRIAREPDAALRERLEDAFRVERERYELTLAITDFTEALLRTFAPRDETPSRWEEAAFRMAPHSRVVHAGWDWTPREDGAGAAEALASPRADVFHLLSRSGNRIHVRRLATFPALVLLAVQQEEATLEEVVERVGEMVPGAEPQELAPRVRDQLRQAWLSGVVDCAPAAVPA